MKNKTKNKQKGFTLLELMIVIATIGLLASIVLTNVSTARSRARDAKRRQDLDQVATALELYFDDHGTYQVANSGSGSTTGLGCGCGWLSYENAATSTYGTSVIHALQLSGYLGVTHLDDPNATANSPGYMIYICGKTFAVSGTLENPTPQDISFIQTTCNGVGANGTYTNYHKNFAVGHN